MRTRSAGILLVLFGLAACGGGGGGEPPPPPPPPPPSPPFEVVSTDPADGATGVARDAGYTIDFSAGPDQNSIAGDNLKLAGPEGNAFATRAEVSAARIRVTTGVPRLPGNTIYTVTIGTTITDIDGRPLASPVTHTFTTAPQVWDATTTRIGQLPYFTGGIVPSVTQDLAGNVYAAWHASMSGAETLFVARRDARTSTWAAPVPVYTAGSSGVIGMFKVLCNAFGDVEVFWNDFELAAQRVRSMRYTAASGTWSGPSELTDIVPPGVEPLGAVPWIDAMGTVTMFTNAFDHLYASRRQLGASSWSTPLPIDLAAASHYLYDVNAVTDIDGNITATWVQNTDNGRYVVGARYDWTSNAWSAAHPIGLSNSGADMGTDGNKVVTVAWSHDHGLARGPTIESARLDLSTGEWSAPVRLDDSSDVSGGAYDASLAVDAVGHATVTWQQFEGLHAARRGPGASTWSAPQRVGGDAQAPAAMAVDEAGNVTAVTASASQGVMAVQYLASDGQWHAPVAIDTPPTGTRGSSNAPRLVIDESGGITAVWFTQILMNGGTAAEVASNRFR